MRAKDLAELLTTELNLLMLFELLGQMVIVKSLVLSPRQFHHPPNDSLFNFTLAGPASVPMNDSLWSLLMNPSFDPITLPLTDPQDHSRSEHRQFTSKHSLYNLYAFLVLHRQGCHRHTLT